MKRRVSRTGGDKIRHPRRYYTPETMAARATVTESGCWVWPGRLTPDGYGQCRYIGKSMLAHRLSYELHVGPIPSGLTIDHLCRNRACINPAHLEPVTHRENQRRAVAATTACRRGHPFTPETTGRDRLGNRFCRVCLRAKRREAYHAKRALEILGPPNGPLCEVVEKIAEALAERERRVA